ncbi:MAG: hypothetical protein KKB09_07540 [Nanoarchaeota archaeon]|nr:hypothetical protein [Nanoarchaeota archaeon]
MIDTLDKYVLKTLENLASWKLPKIDITPGFNLFMGSGNAFQTAKIYANHFGGITVDTTYYSKFVKFKDNFDEIIIISASGGKDGLKMAEAFKGCTLLTCAKTPPAAPFANKIHTFPSMEEPPTYNTSTYASMIYALNPNEDLLKIRKHIESLKIPDLKKYSFIPVVSADKNEPVAQMCATKIRETLGIGSVGKSIAEGMHGWFLHERNDEAALCLNLPDFASAKNKININYPTNLGLMLSAYYLIGKNQTDALSQEILDSYKKVSAAVGWTFGNIH